MYIYARTSGPQIFADLLPICFFYPKPALISFFFLCWNPSIASLFGLPYHVFKARPCPLAFCHLASPEFSPWSKYTDSFDFYEARTGHLGTGQPPWGGDVGTGVQKICIIGNRIHFGIFNLLCGGWEPQNIYPNLNTHGFAFFCSKASNITVRLRNLKLSLLIASGRKPTNAFGQDFVLGRGQG